MSSLVIKLLGIDNIVLSPRYVVLPSSIFGQSYWFSLYDGDRRFPFKTKLMKL